MFELFHSFYFLVFVVGIKPFVIAFSYIHKSKFNAFDCTISINKIGVCFILYLMIHSNEFYVNLCVLCIVYCVSVGRTEFFFIFIQMGETEEQEITLKTSRNVCLSNFRFVLTILRSSFVFFFSLSLPVVECHVRVL